MQVLRVCSFSTFSLPPAFPPCSCPLAFQRQVRRLTSRMSSESYPGYPECAVSCHGAGRFANSIPPFFDTTPDSKTRGFFYCPDEAIYHSVRGHIILECGRIILKNHVLPAERVV